MNTQRSKPITYVAALALVALLAGACTIPLRGGEEQAKIAEPISGSQDPLAAKLTECRSVTYEQNDALADCRRAWAEKRRQFLGQKAPAPSDKRPDPAGSSLFVAPKDESRMPSGYPSIQQPAKE